MAKLFHIAHPESTCHFMLTVFTGNDATPEEQTELSQRISESCPSAEVYFVEGGQDIYPYIFVAE